MVNDGGLSDHENGHKSIAEQGANALDKSLPGTKATVTGSSVPDARTKADTLVDKNVFELPNWSTQILIETQTEWIGVSKADYLEQRLRTWGWDALGEVQEVNWGWQRLGSDSEVVIMGLDRFEVRRMTMAGGYSWVFEAGLGDSFLTPRVSWHSIPANPELGKSLFSEKENQDTPKRQDPHHSLKDFAKPPEYAGS